MRSLFDCLRLWLMVVALRCYVAALLRGLLVVALFFWMFVTVGLVLQLAFNSVDLHVV